MKSTVRRDFLKQAGFMGSAAMMAAFPQGALAFGGANTIPTEEALQAPAESVAKNRIKFAVCGMSHDHIYGMIGAVQRGGGELVAAWGGEPDKLAAFTQALSQREDRRNAGRDPERSLGAARAQFADRQ